MLMRFLIPDKALTWAHRAVGMRLDGGRKWAVLFLKAGGLDCGYIERLP